MKNNEYHHLFRHRSGTWYFQQNGVKKCLGTKEVEKAKSMRDELLETTLDRSIGAYSGMKKRIVYETSDGSVFQNIEEAVGYEKACTAGKVRLSVSSGIDRLFGKEDYVSEKIGRTGLDGFLAELTITCPKKLKALSDLIREASLIACDRKPWVERKEKKCFRELNSK
jgi:hypothetical protein